ncbi:MAG: twin-arginine translocase TatA/TatE family subunit [Dehalococcoidia bacterium]
MFPQLGPMELILILAIVLIVFGVGKLPQTFGSIGKGMREFRKGVSGEEPGAKGPNPPTT